MAKNAATPLSPETFNELDHYATLWFEGAPPEFRARREGLERFLAARPLPSRSPWWAYALAACEAHAESFTAESLAEGVCRDMRSAALKTAGEIAAFALAPK